MSLTASGSKKSSKRRGIVRKADECGALPTSVLEEIHMDAQPVVPRLQKKKRARKEQIYGRAPLVEVNKESDAPATPLLPSTGSSDNRGIQVSPEEERPAYDEKEKVETEAATTTENENTSQTDETATDPTNETTNVENDDTKFSYGTEKDEAYMRRWIDDNKLPQSVADTFLEYGARTLDDVVFMVENHSEVALENLKFLDRIKLQSAVAAHGNAESK